MERLASWIDQINERVGKGVSWLTFGLVLLVFVNVFLRYAFNLPLAWSKELEWHLFALIFLFGAGYSLRHDRHVRVDLFYEKAGKADQRRINFWGTLLFLIPWCLVLIYAGWRAAMDAWRMGERSPETAGLPNLWLIQFALPVGMSLLLLQGIAKLIRSRAEASEQAQ
ncbi:TRAP transporter small permease subunit [Lewinella sp. LCG006]|uniref:TRAP transporter small permease subunit n=1 Tax=Lewinella sp. LCG006 TaxID=3231911 RepID=UPI00345FD73D